MILPQTIEYVCPSCRCILTYRYGAERPWRCDRCRKDWLVDQIDTAARWFS